MRWLTMMLLPKPPMEAMVVLCSRCTTAVMPPSAINRWILLSGVFPRWPQFRALLEGTRQGGNQLLA